MENSTPPGSARFAFPTAYTILFGLLAVAAALTWIIPSGQYERVTDPELGREVAVRGSYHATPPSHRTVFDVLKAPIAGGIGEKAFIESFLDGARDLLGVALIIGLARGALVIMNDGQLQGT